MIRNLTTRFALGILFALSAGPTPAAAQVRLKDHPITNDVSSGASSNYLVVEMTALGTNSTQLISVANFGNVRLGAELFVDASIGSDATGTRGRPDKPFATPAAAKNAAQEADAIIVWNGTYTGAGVSNLFKAGKLTWILDDPTFDYIDLSTNATTGAGIFDDRFAGGGCSNTVIGSVKLRYCPGTNIVFDEVCTTYTTATNALAAIVVTNEASEIQWSALTDLRHWGPGPMPFALAVKNCRPLTFFKNFSLITNGAPSATISVSNCPALPGEPIPVEVGANFLDWELGTFSFEFDQAPGPWTQYAFNFYGITNTDAAEIRMTGNFVDGKMYVVGYSKNYKVWARFMEWRNASDNVNLINCYRSGSHYFDIQKASCKLGAVIDFSLSTPESDTNLTVWVDIPKLSGSNGWINVTHGQLRGRIGHFDQNGPNTGTPGILVTNISALVSLTGENAYSANTFLDHGGGVTELHGYNVTTTNRDPVLVRGSGLTLDVAALNTISGTNSIRASSAQSVTIQRGYAGPDPHTNVTLTGTNRAGYLALDGHLRIQGKRFAYDAANENIFIGNDSTVPGMGSIFIGYNAGSNSTGNSDTVFIGSGAGWDVLGAEDIVAIGPFAAFSATNSGYMVALGYGAGAQSLGPESVFLGLSAGNGAKFADYSVGIGSTALYHATNSHQTVAIGRNSGEEAYDSNLSVFLGARSGYGTHRNSTLAIETNPSHTDGSTNSLIYGQFDTRFVRINGDLSVTTNIRGSKIYGTNLIAGVGATSTNANVGGAIGQSFTVFTNHSSASLNFTNLVALNLSANSITNQGDTAIYRFHGRFKDAQAATNQLQLGFGSRTNILDTGFQFASNTCYAATIAITCVASNKQFVTARLEWGKVNSGVTGVPWLETNACAFIAETNGIANTVRLGHMGPGAFGVTNEALFIDYRRGYSQFP